MHDGAGPAAVRRAAVRCAALLSLACAPTSHGLAGSNVLLVVVDALRADHLGFHGYARPTSPFLDEMAARSVVFETATSTASHTVPAVLSLLTSSYPHRHGNQWFPATQSVRAPRRRVRPEVPQSTRLLAEHFAALGYRTAAVVTNPWLAARYGFGRGFAEYVHLGKDRTQAGYVSGDQVQRAAGKLLRGSEPFFLYVHYMDVHSPYDPPKSYREDFATGEGRFVYSNGPVENLRKQDLEYTIGLYDAQVRSLDDHLRNLIGSLQEAGLQRPTLVVFTADHGDEFHEHGGMGHGQTLYQEVLRVPLLFQHPALEPRRLASPVSLVDVAPTLLDLVGAPPPADLDGISLARWLRGAGEPPAERVLVSELGHVKAVRRGALKWIRHASEADRGFDLAADPAEQRPLREPADSPPDLQAALAALPLEPVQPSARPAPDSPAEQRLDQALEALGYAH